jgi:hypothetical protein
MLRRRNLRLDLGSNRHTIEDNRLFHKAILSVLCSKLSVCASLKATLTCWSAPFATVR